MSELRQNRVTGEWVIIATERAGRPEDFHRSVEKSPLPEHNPRCPFCPGNEKMTPAEHIADRPGGGPPDSGDWQVRVIPNKFPALSPLTEADWFEEAQFFNGVKGYGIHDVIIDHPRHDLTIATMGKEDVKRVFRIYRERYRAIEKEERIRLINIFRNNGAKAGASLEHPHSQLIATPIIPTRIQMRLDVAKEHYEIHGSCIMCDTIRHTLSVKERLVLNTDNFIVFHPFASQTPFETWIVPKHHYASFGDTSDEDIDELAVVMRDMLYRIYSALGDPDYNYLIQANPSRSRYGEKYHWYAQILPRIIPSVGFELSSGIYICTSKPEETADFIKNTPGPPDE